MTWETFGIVLLSGYVGYLIGRIHSALTSTQSGSAT